MITRKDELKAIRQSIKHWCVDLRRPLLNGDKIIIVPTKGVPHSVLEWKKSNKLVLLGCTHCALCEAPISSCEFCPLYITTKETCNNPHSLYRKFIRSKDISAANAMISALVRTYWQYNHRYE